MLLDYKKPSLGRLKKKVTSWFAWQSHHPIFNAQKTVKLSIWGVEKKSDFFVILIVCFCMVTCCLWPLLVFPWVEWCIGIRIFTFIASNAMTRIHTISRFSVREPGAALSPLAIHFECVQILVFCFKSLSMPIESLLTTIFFLETKSLPPISTKHYESEPNLPKPKLLLPNADRSNRHCLSIEKTPNRQRSGKLTMSSRLAGWSPRLC